MAKIKLGKWEITEKELDKQIDAATKRGNKALRTESRAKSAHYDSKTGRVVIDLINGCTFMFPADFAQGLQGATKEELSDIRILGSGTALIWTRLDASFSVDGLVKGIFGTKSWMASDMGRKGGSAKTESKATAARANGAKGGRPKKSTVA